MINTTMVRETRHLWVGNLPENIREERLIDYFKRYGKVQSVRIFSKSISSTNCGTDNNGQPTTTSSTTNTNLPTSSSSTTTATTTTLNGPNYTNGGGSFLCNNSVSATVAFIDIKSAAKAHSSENKIEERTLKTDYYEPHRHHSDDHHSSLNATTKLSSSNITTNNSSAVNNYNHNNSNAVACSSSSTSSSSSCSGGVGSTVLSSTSSSSSSSLTAAAAASSSSSTISAATLSNSGSSSNNLLSGTGTLSSNTTATNVPPLTAAIQQQQQSSLGTVSNTTLATSSSTSAIAAAASSSSSSTTATTTTSSSSSTTNTSSSSPATPLSSNASLYGRHTPIRYNSTIVLESNSTNNNQSASSSAHHHHHHHSSSSSSSSSTTATSQLSSSLVNNNTTTTTIGAGALGGTGSGGGHSNFPGVSSSPKDDHISMTTSSSSLLNDREESSRQNNNTTATTTAICVRKISHRLTDSNIKESLFYEFKRYGKIIQTLVRGQGSDRHAIVVFNKPEEAEKALKDSKDKQFLGSRVEITPCDYSDIVGDCNNNRNNNNENIDNDYDVYHPRATRTLFVGNLDKEVSYGDLAKKFSQFGEIMEIDIKKQNQPYAFIRFNNISSVVKAMRRYDNEPMGGTKLKLGYGKSFSSCCIWIGDYKDSFSDVKGIEKYLNKYGQVNRVLPDCEQRSVLCFFETHEEAKKAVEDLRQKSINGRRVNVDFASRDYQTYFLEKRTPLNNNNNGAGGGLNNDNNTSNNSHRGRSGSWISSNSANSVDYDDQRTYDRSSRSTSSYHHHQLNSRSSSSSSLLQVRSNSGNNGNNVNSGGNGGSSSYSSLRQRSQTPPPSPPSTDLTSFNSRHSLSQSSSLHGGGSNSRVSSKHDYHPSSRASYGRYSPPNDDEDDVDEESHHSSSSNHKRESSSSSSRYSRSHHLSDSFLPTDMASPKIRRDSSPYSSLKLDSDFPHRSSSLSNRNSSSNLANNNSNSDDIKSSHDDVGAGHGVSRRSNHSKLFHMSRRGIGVMAGDSPTPQHQSSSSSSAQQQYRKSGLSSSSSSSTSSSNSRSPIGRESKSSSHYQDRTSVSPPPSPRLNHHHHQYSYHDGDRPIGTSNTTTTTTSIINDGSNIGDHHHHSHAHQWRRKSTDDNNHHTTGGGGGGVGSVGGIGSDVLRLKSDSIIDINNSDVINNSSSSSSSTTTSSSHREHGRDYRDRFRDSSNHRTNSLLTTSSSLGSYQNRSSDSYAKRRLNSSLEVDENSSDLPGHLERKKRLMACVEQSSSNSSLTNSSSTSLVNQSGSLLTSTVSSNSNLATSNDNKSTSSKNSMTNHVTNLSILNDVKLLHSSKNVSRDPINTTAAASSSSSSSSSSCSSTAAGSLLVDHHLHQTSKRRLSNTANSVGIANNSGCVGGGSSIGISGNPYTEGNFKDLKPILQYYLAEGNLNQHQTNAMLTLLNPEQSKATTLQLLNSSSNNKGSATIPSTAASTTNISTTVTSSSAASTVSSKSGASGGGPSVGNICGFSSTSSTSGSSVVGQTPALTTATTASTTATAATSLATMNNVNSLNSTATTIASLATTSTKTKTKDMCPTITLRTIDVCTSSVNQSLMDPRISGHNYSGGSGNNSSKSIYSSRISCDNDLKNPKLSETSSSSSSNHHHHHHHHHSKHQSCEYGPSSPWNLPLPEFAKAQQLKTNTTAAILTGDNATKSHLSSLSLSLATAINSNIVIQNSSTTAMISNPLSAALSSLSNTTSSNNLTHIPSLTESSVRNLTGSSPKNANIMSPLGNLSPVPKHRLSRDRISTETNSFDFKRSADRIDLDDVSDTDMGGNFLSDDKLKPLDEKHNAWSGTSCTTPTLKSERTPTIDYSKYNIKKKSQSNTNTNGSTSLNNNSSNENDSTDLKNILSSSSVFDQDSKRLEHLNEKYEPKDVSTLDLDSIGSSTSAHKISLSSRTKFSSSIPSSLVLPTDKTSSLLVNSLDTLPKTTTTSTTPLNTPLSSSSSSSAANTAFHYNHHPPYHHHTHPHHHHSISSSNNNLIPTTTSSSVSSSSNMSRKFSTESSLSASNSNNATNRTNQIKKDYSITPTTPGSAPVRSTATMFPQFSRSSSIPTSSNTAPNTPTTLVNNNNSNSRTLSSSFNRKDSSGGVQSSNSCYPPQNNSNSGGNQLSRQASETKQYKLDPMNKSSSSASNVSKTIQSSASSSCSSSSSSSKSGGGDHQNPTMKKDHNVAVNKSTVQDQQQQQQQGHHSNKNKHEISSTNNLSSNKNEFKRKEVERKNSSTGSDHGVSNNNNCTSTQDVMKYHHSSGGGGNYGKSKSEPSKHSSKESLKDDDNNPGNGNNNNNNNNNNREPTSRKASMEKQNSGGSREQQKSSSNETSKTMDKEKKIDSSNTNSKTNNNNNNIIKKGELSNQVTKEKEREKMKKKSKEKEKEKEYSNKNNTDKDSGSNKDREQRRGGEDKDRDKEQQCSKRKCTRTDNRDKSNKNSSSNKRKEKSKNSDKQKKKDKHKDKNKKNKKNSNLHDYDDEPIYFSMYDKVKARSSDKQNKNNKPNSMDSNVGGKQNQSIKREDRKDDGKSSQDLEDRKDDEKSGQDSEDRKDDEKSSQDSEEDSDDSFNDRKNFKSKSNKRKRPSSSSSSSSDEDDEDDDEKEDEEAEDSEVDSEDFSKYSTLKKSKKPSNHDDDSCSTTERSHYHGRGSDDDYCGNSKRNKSSNKRDEFSEFLNDDDSSETSNMISSISSSRSINKNMGKSKKNSSSSSDKYPSLSISSDEDGGSKLMKYLDFERTKKSNKEKDRYSETSGAKVYSSKNCGDRKMKNDKFPTNMDIKTMMTKAILGQNDDFAIKVDDEDDSIARAWKMENREKKKKKRAQSSENKQKNSSFKTKNSFKELKKPAELNSDIYYNMYDGSSDDSKDNKPSAKELAEGLKLKSRPKKSGRDRFSSSSSSCNKGKIKRMSHKNTLVKIDDEDSSSNVSELLNDKKKKKSIKNKDKFCKDSLSNDDCDKIDDHSLADEKHRIEMTSDMYMLLSPNSKFYRQKSHSLDYRPGSPSPPPRTPEISSPLSSPSYSDNIITSQVDDNSYPDKTIDEELINESKTILRHFNENDSSSDSCLSELEGGHHDLVTGDSNDFNALIPGQASLGNLVTIHQNDNDESSKSVSPFEQNLPFQRNYDDDEAIIHLQKEIETDLIQGQSVGHFPGFETITTNITTENDQPMIQQIPAEFLSSPESSSSACKIVDNRTATLIMAKLEPNNAIILDNGDEIIGQPFNNESVIVEDANEQQPSSLMPTTIDVTETRIEDNDVECQRKKEDDLAVAALLQDMNDPCARITGPSVETDQIEAGASLHGLQFILADSVDSDQPVMIDQEQIMETPEKAGGVVLMVDDQELKAAVQEIETSGQDILEKDEAKDGSTVASTPPIAVVMLNNDYNQCDHELIVDDNVLEKSLQESIDLAKEQGKQIIISTTDPNSTMTTESLQLIANKILSPKNTNAMIIKGRRHSHDQSPFMFEIVEVDGVHQQLQSDCTQMESVPETDQTLNVEEIDKTLLEENQSTQLNMPILKVINDQDSSGETLATFCMSPGSENFDAELFSKTTMVTMQLPPDDNKMVVDNSDNNKTIEQQKVRIDVTENESAEATKMDEQQEQEQNSAINDDINNKDAAVIINNNIQKRSIEEIEPDSTNECASKPKRSRRTKNRKNSDSLMHSPRSESQQLPQNDTSVSFSNSLTINTNLPTATNVALLSPTSQSSVSSDVSPGSQTKQPRGKQQQQGGGSGSGSGSGGYSYSIRRSVRTAAVAASAVNSTTLEELDDTDYSMDEQPGTFKDEQHEDDNKKKQSKRGRKKKNSPNVESQANKANENNDHKKTLLSATNTAATSTTFAMAGATNISIGTNANRPKSPRAYDVFEFTDEEDEGPLTLDHIKTPHFMSSSNVLDETKHLFEKRHQNDNGAINTTVTVDVSAEAKQQQPEAAVVSTVSSTFAEMNATLSPTTIAAAVAAVGTSSSLGICPKEYVSEVNQSGKLVIRLQDSGNNDGKMKEDVKFVEESASSSTAAAINDNSTLKGVRKSARLMSAQGAKSTSDEIGDEQSAAMKNVAAANNTNQNKVEGEKQGNATCKRVTRSNRKSDDGVQPTTGNNGGQDSEEEQDESKTRNYRVTRSRGSNVQEDPTSKKTESSSSSSDDVTLAKSTNEENNEIIMKNADDGCQSTTATLPTTTMAESEQLISTVINVPITSSTGTLSSEPKKSESLSVIQSTGNVEKIANIAQTVVATATTPTLSTTVTATTTVPTVPITPEVPSANVAVITSTPMTMITTPPTIKSPSIIDHHQNMKFVPSFSERLHNSPTTCALKLKTGKGLIYESIMSGEKIPSIDLNATSAAAPTTTTTTATFAPSLVTMSPVITGNNVNVHTTVHIKPKFQHPVGQQATEILRPISESPNIVANSGPNVMNDPVKTIPPSVSSMTPPSMAESIKNLNINCNNGNQPPPLPPNTSAVPLNPTSKPFLHNKSVLQVAGVNAQPLSNPPELNLSYPGNLLNTTASSHPNMSSADIFLQQQQEYLNSLQKQQQSQPMPFINPQQIASLAQGRPPQPPVSGANQIINPSMIPMANYEFDICNQIHLWNPYPNVPGMRPQQMTMPQRYIYNAAANFPCHPPPPGLTPEQIEQATAAALQQQQQQKSHLASKSQKDEMHRAPSSFNEDMKLHPESSFPIDMASLNASRNYPGMRHFGPILALPPERFPLANEAVYLQYGLNGQNRNLSTHPMNYGQDLSKQQPPLEPKRPSSKPFPSPSHSPAYRKDLAGNGSSAESNVEILRNPISNQFIASKDPNSQQPSAATTLNNNDPPLNMSTFQRVPSPNLPQPLSRPSSECSVFEQSKRVTPPDYISSVSPAAAASLPPPPTSNYGPTTTTPPQQEGILQRHPQLWSGLLAMKGDQTAVQMHYICGNKTLAAQALSFHQDNSFASLRITQRMRIDSCHLNQVEKKIQSKDDFCILIALPCGRDSVDVLQQSNNLYKYFITYLQSKHAAGIVNDSAYGYVMHIFPPGEYSDRYLVSTAPNLLSFGISHLMVVITTSSNSL